MSLIRRRRRSPVLPCAARKCTRPRLGLGLFCREHEVQPCAARKCDRPRAGMSLFCREHTAEIDARIRAAL